jgi:ADP-ribose pyrophosphatase YjhB (NUDIX family)
MVREAVDGDRWTLPGGWADVNESPADAVMKEVREESGFDVRAVKLAAVWDRARHPHTPPYAFHIWKLFFVCEITGGEARGGLETSGVAFFGENELPRDLSVSRVLLPQLRAYAPTRTADGVRLKTSADLAEVNAAAQEPTGRPTLLSRRTAENR